MNHPSFTTEVADKDIIHGLSESRCGQLVDDNDKGNKLPNINMLDSMRMTNYKWRNLHENCPKLLLKGWIQEQK